MVRFSRRQQSGFTIVEILIALALGVLLSSALVQIFSSSQAIASMESSLSRVQETGRFAMETLAKDIRMAGYQGCADPNDLDVYVIAKNFKSGQFDFSAIKGFEVKSDGNFSPSVAAGTHLAGIQGKAREGSDVVSVTFASTENVTLTSATGPDANLNVSAIPSDLNQDDYALVSDCKSAHLFQVTNTLNGLTITHGGNSNDPHNKLTPAYQEGAQIMTFESRVYYVKDTGRDTDTGAPVYALFMRDFDGAEQEILEGVESLQVLYGQQVGAGQLRYVKADDSDLNWDQVVSVRIGILVQGYAQVADVDDTRTYELPGASISNTGLGKHAGDRTLRKPFITTIKLRNRRQEI